MINQCVTVHVLLIEMTKTRMNIKEQFMVKVNILNVLIPDEGVY